MITLVTDILVTALIVIGCLFFVLGTVGILRMPDALTRLHPSTQCDTLGAGSVILAMVIYNGNIGDDVRLLFIGLFLFISSATCGHAIGRSVVMSRSNHSERTVKIPKENDRE